MTERMRLAVEIVMENGQFKAEIVNSEKLTKQLGQTGKDSFGALGEAAGRLDGPIGRVTRSFQGLLGMSSRLAIGLYAGVAALAAWGAGVLKGTQIAGEHERELKRLEAQVRATGMAAGRSAEQLDEQAQRLSRVTLFDDNEIRKAQGILLSFRSVTGQVFDETIMTAANLAEVMGTDLAGAVLQLGKALEDPEQGLSALTRSGVSFNASQKETIKGFVETGQKGKALELILATVNAQLGPTATAAADGYAGAMHRVAESWEDFLEALGKTDTMQWWLDKIDRALQGLRRIVSETEREEFNDLFSERRELKAKIERDPYWGYMGGDKRLAEIDARMRELQDNEVARQKKASSEAGGGGVGRRGGDGNTGRPTPEYESDVRDQIREFNEAIGAAGLAERAELQAIIDKYDEVGAAQRERTADLVALNEAAIRGDEKAIEALNMIAAGVDTVDDATKKASGSLDVFADEAARNIQNIGVAFLRGRSIGEGFFESMLNGLADLAAELAVQAALRSLFNSMAGSGSGALSAIGTFFGGVTPAVAHSGGVIGRDALPTREVPAFVFAGAPRYHSGMLSSWLRPNERPAILEVGESVLTPAQMQAVGGGGRFNFAPVYNINASGGTTAAQVMALQRVFQENNRMLKADLAEAKLRKL